MTVALIQSTPLPQTCRGACLQKIGVCSGGNGGLPVPQHHYVLGDASPFIFELGHHEDWSESTRNPQPPPTA